jgi:hypothetical protein
VLGFNASSVQPFQTVRGREDRLMAGDGKWNEREPERSRRSGRPVSRWPDYLQFVFVVVLTVVFLLLAVSMKRHHFLRGELYQQSHPYDR